MGKIFNFYFLDQSWPRTQLCKEGGYAKLLQIIWCQKPSTDSCQRVLSAFKSCWLFSDGGSLMILRKVPQRSEEAAFTVGLRGEMGVFKKLRTAWKGEERARKQQVTSTCGLILGSCKWAKWLNQLLSRCPYFHLSGENHFDPCSNLLHWEQY